MLTIKIAWNPKGQFKVEYCCLDVHTDCQLYSLLWMIIRLVYGRIYVFVLRAATDTSVVCGRLLPLWYRRDGWTVTVSYKPLATS